MASELLARGIAAYALWRVLGDVRAARRIVRGIEARALRLTVGLDPRTGCLTWPRGWDLASRMLEPK